MVSVSNDASTQLLVWRVILEPEAERDANDLAGFDGDVSANFALDFEQVLRGERRDGPGCGASAGRLRRADTDVVENNSAFP
jgi:hypothetical protein